VQNPLSQYKRPEKNLPVSADLHAAVYDLLSNWFKGQVTQPPQPQKFRWVILTGATVQDTREVGSTTTDVRWSYTWVEAYFDSAYGVFKPMTDGESDSTTDGEATNVKEDLNLAGNILCGVYDFSADPFLSNPDIKLQPVANTVVQLWEVVDDDTGVIQYRFDVLNGVQGPCAA